jgi:hypothetical protein
MDLRLALIFEPKSTFAVPWGQVQKVSRRALTKRKAALGQAEEILETVRDVLGHSAMEREDILEYLSIPRNDGHGSCGYATATRGRVGTD